MQKSDISAAAGLISIKFNVITQNVSLSDWLLKILILKFQDDGYSAILQIDIIIIIIIIKGIYIAQVRKGHKCAMSAEMAVWLRNCLYLYSYLSHN